MYKTSVITDEISQDLPFAARVAREYGLQGLEIRSVNEKNPFQMNADDLRFVKQIADDSGLEICCVSSPMFKCSLDDLETRRAHMDSFRRMMDTMHSWNTKLIRCFNFFNDVFKPLLKFPAVFCAGHQGSQIQCYKPFIV